VSDISDFLLPFSFSLLERDGSKIILVPYPMDPKDFFPSPGKESIRNHMGNSIILPPNNNQIKGISYDFGMKPNGRKRNCSLHDQFMRN
jgi:hypothetical protein